MSLFAAEKSPHAVAVDAGPTVSGWWPWAWMGLACVVLGVSGVVRVWQDARFHNMESRGVVSLFALKEIPMEVGGGLWRAGHENPPLDEQITRIAGLKDHIIRSYVDQRTGVVVDVLVSFGRSEQVSIHVPEVCYPAAGYQPADAPFPVAVPLLGQRGERLPDAKFRAMTFVRPGKFQERVEVYYSFRQNDRWSPTPDGNFRSLSLSPGMYKVQIQRRIAEKERRFDRRELNPTASFLTVFLPEIERMLIDKQLAAAPR